MTEYTEYRVKVRNDLKPELNKDAGYNGITPEELIALVTEAYILRLFPPIDIGKIVQKTTTGFFPKPES